MIRVVLVDDERLVRRGLQMHLALEPDLVVIGEAGNGQEAIELVQAVAPDVVVMDITMPGLDGIATTACLRETMPSAAVIILTLHGDADTRARAGEAGAAAFVEKEGGIESLLKAIRAVAPKGAAAEGAEHGYSAN